MQVKLDNLIAFKRQLKPSEESEYRDVLNQSKHKVGNKGHSILIVPSSSLPNGIENNTGCGNLLSKESREFVDFAKLYWGVNYIQLLPEGEHGRKTNGFRPYSGSSLDLGTQLINLEELTKQKYAKLLTESDIKKVVDSNLRPDKDIHINLENTLDYSSSTDKTLRKAFDELLKEDTAEKKNLLSEIENYRIQNGEWIEKKSVYKALSVKNGTRNCTHWNDIEANLFNEEKVSKAQRDKILNEIDANPVYKKEKKFYVFKQYIAEKHLEEAKKDLNSKGIKLSGDMIVGCSNDEKWMYPKAFHHKYSGFWGLNAINFDSPDGKEFFKLKVRNFAKRYDGIRVDAGWLYISQYLENKNNPDEKICKEYGSEILNILENEVKSVKGENFDLNNIMYEFEADAKLFKTFAGNEVRPEIRDRLKIYKTDYMGKDWATTEAFRRRGIYEGSYVLGVTNHDSISLKDLYNIEGKRNEQASVLADLLKIPKNKIQTFSEFTQAKFAETIRSTHNMVFFSDALNLGESYAESRTINDAYRLKIPSDYKEKYFKSLENGEGFNIMDSLQKAFEAEGLDKTESKLYKKICKYNKILKENEAGFSKSKVIILAVSVALTVFATAVFIYRQHIKTEQKM